MNFAHFRTPGKYGRIEHDYRKNYGVALSDYLTASLPVAPSIVDRSSGIAWPMYGNDSIGDCTCAAVGHEIQAFTRYASSLVTVPESAVVDAYSAITGYDPVTGANDNGAEISDVLNYWQKTGVGGHKIVAWATVDYWNKPLMKQVLNTFGTVYLGLEVPQSAEYQFSAGLPWSVSKTGTNIVGGHAVPIQRWDDAAVGVIEVVTWGALQRMTLAFCRKYVDEAYVPISQDWITANGTTIEGLALSELIADSKALSA